MTGDWARVLDADPESRRTHPASGWSRPELLPLLGDELFERLCSNPPAVAGQHLSLNGGQWTT